MSYSRDLKVRVVESIAGGMSWSEAIDVFKVSRNSIGRWRREYGKHGDFLEKVCKTHKHRKIDPLLLQEEIEKTPDATLAELAKRFNTWPSCIDYRLRKLKITRKKKRPCIKSAARKKGSSTQPKSVTLIPTKLSTWTSQE